MKIAVLLLFALVFLVPVCPADFFTVNYTGHLTIINDPNNIGGFTVGQTFSGSYTVDTSVPPTYSFPNGNIYHIYIPSTFKLGDFTPNNYVYYLEPSVDLMTGSQSYQYMIQPAYVQPGVYVTVLGFNLFAPDGGVFTTLTSDYIPQFEQFAGRDFSIRGLDDRDHDFAELYRDGGVVDAISVSRAVPEPTSLLLLGAGVLVLRKFRKWGAGQGYDR